MTSKRGPKAAFNRNHKARARRVGRAHRPGIQAFVDRMPNVLAWRINRFLNRRGARTASAVLRKHPPATLDEALTPSRRVSGNQYLHHQSEAYRHAVRRKIAAYHRHIQLGLIAEGLLQMLSAKAPKLVWQSSGFCYAPCDHANKSWPSPCGIPSRNFSPLPPKSPSA